MLDVPAKCQSIMYDLADLPNVGISLSVSTHEHICFGVASRTLGRHGTADVMECTATKSENIKSVHAPACQNA